MIKRRVGEKCAMYETDERRKGRKGNNVLSRADTAQRERSQHCVDSWKISEHTRSHLVFCYTKMMNMIRDQFEFSRALERRKNKLFMMHVMMKILKAERYIKCHRTPRQPEARDQEEASNPLACYCKEVVGFMWESFHLHLGNITWKQQRQTQPELRIGCKRGRGEVKNKHMQPALGSRAIFHRLYTAFQSFGFGRFVGKENFSVSIFHFFFFSVVVFFSLRSQFNL